MYYVSKRIEVAGAHFLQLDYPSPCSNLHGHNWIIIVHCKAEQLNKNGMVVDFTKIKAFVNEHMDHKCLNDTLPDVNPTAENIAHFIANGVTNIMETGYCYKVSVQESEGNIAVYEADTKGEY